MSGSASPFRSAARSARGGGCCWRRRPVAGGRHLVDALRRHARGAAAVPGRLSRLPDAAVVPRLRPRGRRRGVRRERRAAHQHAPCRLGRRFMGGGIATMHYIGMTALHASAHMNHDPGFVAASVVIAIATSGLALWLASGRGGRPPLLLSATALGIAIAGMHYTAMAGLDSVPARAPALDRARRSRPISSPSWSRSSPSSSPACSCCSWCRNGTRRTPRTVASLAERLGDLGLCASAGAGSARPAGERRADLRPVRPAGDGDHGPASRRHDAAGSRGTCRSSATAPPSSSRSTTSSRCTPMRTTPTSSTGPRSSSARWRSATSRRGSTGAASSASIAATSSMSTASSGSSGPATTASIELSGRDRYTVPVSRSRRFGRSAARRAAMSGSRGRRRPPG